MNDRSRPKAAPEIVPTTNTSVCQDAETLAYICQVSREIGWVACVEQWIADSHAIARAARPTWVHPTHTEIEARRVLDHMPCPTGRFRPCPCSRCTHALAYRRRGGRPFRGVDAEAELARAGAA